MKKIKTIALQNFQSHKDTSVCLDDGVTVLSGETNHGKTVILRGLSWVITNRPAGIGFISKWAKEKNNKGEMVLKKDAVCSVTMTITGDDDKEHTITRLRTRDKNAYVVDGIELEAVGTAVPDEVSTLLGIHDCNMQSQDDPYFMLTLPPGQVASKLNELVHLDTIDKAYEYGRKGKHRCAALVREWESVLGEEKYKLDGLKHIPDLVEKAKDLQDLVGEYDELTEESMAMQELLRAYREQEQLLDRLPVCIDSELETLSSLMESLTQVEELCDGLKACLEGYEAIAEALAGIPEIFEEDMETLDRDIDTFVTCQENLSLLLRLKTDYERNEQELRYIEEQIVEAEKDLPDTCPLCNQPIDKEVL